MQYKVVGRIMDCRRTVGYKLLGEDNKEYNVDIDELISKIKSGIVINMRYKNGFKGVGVDLRRLPVSYVGIQINGKSNHDLAKEYESKSRLIGGVVLVLEYNKNDNVRLVEVLDKESTGRLVIPKFVTSVRSKALERCKFTEVYVDNRGGKLFNASGLCYGMLSRNLKVVFRNPECIMKMKNIFKLCKEAVKIDVSGINTKNVNNLEGAFNGCRSLKAIDLSNWDMGKVENMSYIFEGCEKLVNIKLNKSIKNVVYMMNSFKACIELKKLDLDGIDISKLALMNNMLSGCYELSELRLNVIDRNEVNNRVMQGMFSGCYKLSEIDISKIKTSKVTDMSGMFNNCTSLEMVNGIGKIDTTRLMYTRLMFNGCNELKVIDISKWNTKNIVDMGYMFNWCKNLELVNIGSIDISNVKDMGNMFNGCTKLESLGVKGVILDLSNVRSKNGIFNGTRLNVSKKGNKVIVR